MAFGVVHLIVAWIALQVAWSGQGDASAGGALRELGEEPYGATLLWLSAGGFVALVLWQAATAVWGYTSEKDAAARMRKRASAAGRAIVHAVLAWTSFTFASDSSQQSSGDSKEEGLTADIMSAPWGRVLLILVAIGILIVAGRSIYRGATDRFTRDLVPQAITGPFGPVITWSGRTGYVAKGVAIAIIGILFAWAALSYDSEKAGGLDDALKTLKQQPFGPSLLSAVAAGLAAFGLFCFAWARYMRQR